MVLISKKQLNQIHEFINLNHEVCGYIEPHGSDLRFLFSKKASVKDETKGVCEYDRYEPMLWHTHAISHLGYPSMEDINKSIKSRRRKDDIVIQLIFTSWGVWELFCSEKTNVDIKILDRDINNGTNRVLYFKSNKGRTVPDHQSVTDYTNALMSLPYMRGKFYITFTPWSVIGDHFKLQYSDVMQSMIKEIY